MFNPETFKAPGRQRGEVSGPGPTLRDLALACVGGLLFADPRAEPVGAEQGYLYNHYRRLEEVGDLPAALERALIRPASGEEPVVELARLLALGPAEVLALVLALLVEEEPMVGRTLAHLQAPVGGARPSLGLLELALAPLAPGPSRWLVGDLLAGPAVAAGVLQLLNEQAPLPEQMVKVPQGLVLVLRGRPLVWPGTEAWSSAVELRLPPSALEMAQCQARALGRGDHSVLVIRSASRREARTLAAEVATRLGLTPLLISAAASELKGLGAVCLLGRRLPVFEFGVQVGEQMVVPELFAYHGPRLVLAGPDGQVRSERGSISQWQVLPPGREERQRLWNDYLGQPELAERLAREHIHSSGRIAELAQLAEREAGLMGRSSPELPDLRRAAWEAEAGSLDSLAQPLPAAVPDEALVLSRSVAREMQQLLARCRCREDLDQSLGVTIKARHQQGVRCLLVGPSGTGKTLAAGWLATRLGLPLYRVDLASVVSKYIGETEKNLATLLARAEHSEIVLLFDEADSLFGKRTDIKDSNDRFANSQTNYLLQRIEFYRGIVLLTSNSRERFDTAFTRRLDKIIDFPLPSPQERRLLWQSHLGSGHRLTPSQINQLAVGCDLAGGDIRNAVLSAAVTAREADREITMEDVVEGLLSEYRKLGRQFPVELRVDQRGR
ncbi:ATP-binding protein [Desulfurivibrio sp. D14AmB]|uniref:ATP-binding protein n=1 Tax=Desulfurivibrio sp. D14AmB TaxID=3374370 RepID=UPI00376ED34C